MIFIYLFDLFSYIFKYDLIYFLPFQKIKIKAFDSLANNALSKMYAFIVNTEANTSIYNGIIL